MFRPEIGASITHVGDMALAYPRLSLTHILLLQRAARQSQKKRNQKNSRATCPPARPLLLPSGTSPRFAKSRPSRGGVQSYTLPEKDAIWQSEVRSQRGARRACRRTRRSTVFFVFLISLFLALPRRSLQKQDVGKA